MIAPTVERSDDTSAQPPLNGIVQKYGLLLFWIACALFLIARRWAEIVALKLPDTDDNLRLAQIRDLLGGQGWFDLRQYRLDPPLGADIHWTRLVDIPYALTISGLSPIVGSALAERVAVVAGPLVILGLTMIVLVRIARQTIGADGWIWSPVLVMTATPVLVMMSPLRIDHHGAQLLFLIAMLWGLITTSKVKGGLVAGTAMALSLVIGVEMLPFLALGAGCAALFWIIDDDETARLRSLALAVAGVTGLGLLCFMPRTAWQSDLCDQLTLAYYPAVLAGGAALFGATLIRARSWPVRLALAGIAGGIAVVALWQSGGVDCLTDPYRAIDPVARTLWLDHVSEAKPLWRQSRETAWSMLAFPLIGLGGAAWMWRQSAGVAKRPWAIILLIGVASVGVCVLSLRAGIPAQLVAIPGAAAVVHRVRQRLIGSPSVLIRVFGTVAALAFVSGVVPRLAIMAATHETEKPTIKADIANAKACERPANIATLDRLPPATFMTGIDLSPALIVHSHHRAIAGPYHRNGAAIAGLMQAFAGDMATARAFIAAHKIDYVLICPGMNEVSAYAKRGPTGFQQQLLTGHPPGWLMPVKAHPAYRLYRVR